MSDREIIEGIIWEYKNTLSINKVMEKYEDILNTIRNPRVVYQIFNKNKESDLDTILKYICDTFVVAPNYVIAKGSGFGTERYTPTRNCFCYVANKVYGYSFIEIGRFLSNRCHSTIINSCEKHLVLIDADEEYNKKFRSIMEHITTITTPLYENMSSLS